MCTDPEFFTKVNEVNEERIFNFLTADCSDEHGWRGPSFAKPMEGG
jgi:hypothetical protein